MTPRPTGQAHHQPRPSAITFGPRLNAVGRLDDARWAYELLLTPDAARATELAQKLEDDNRKRQAATKQSLEQARAMVLARDPNEKLILVATPAVGAGRGRAGRRAAVRRIPPPRCRHRRARRAAAGDRPAARSHFDIYAALSECRDEGVFDGGRMGGHTMAAGFTIRTENIEALHEQLLELAESELNDDQLSPQLKADAELTLEDCTLATVDEVSRLEPFGKGNPPPHLCGPQPEGAGSGAVQGRQRAPAPEAGRGRRGPGGTDHRSDLVGQVAEWARATRPPTPWWT